MSLFKQFKECYRVIICERKDDHINIETKGGKIADR